MEDGATVTGDVHENLVKSDLKFWRYARGQTDRYTNTQTHALNSTQSLKTAKLFLQTSASVSLVLWALSVLCVKIL